MVTVDNSFHRKYVTYDIKGVLLLYLMINKELYGLLNSALLFYKKMRGELKSIGL